jgi:integrase
VALDSAVKWGLLARNPADAVTPPRSRRDELAVWDAPTIRKFLDGIDGSPFRDMFRLAILTGMRRSEISGLKWDVVDLERGEVRVVRTLHRVNGLGMVEGQPKTAKSRRSVVLSPEAVQVLHAVRGRQIEERTSAGDSWHNTGYVFTQPDGRPRDPNGATHAFADWTKKLGMPHLTFHGLRHVHATLLLAAGVHPKVVSERLRHSTIALTLDTYSHVLPTMQKEAAAAIEQQLHSGSGA